MSPKLATSTRWLLVTQSATLLMILILAVIIYRPKQSTSQYPFIAKRLFVANPNDIILNFTSLRSKIADYINASDVKIGLYFEYLPTGVSINVNGNDEFYRASLVKLPVVMRTYKLIEEGQLSLEDTLTLEAKQINKDYGTLWQRGVGAKFSVRELINFVLQDSDNTAFNVLYERVNVQLLHDAPNDDQASDDVYDYLDIPRATAGTTPMITPRNYTSILKSLYFSAYLPFQDSNSILEVMSKSHTTDWIRSTIPSQITFADKIGSYNVEPESYHVFSDCGIVYYPERPYSICIMVHSNDQEKSVQRIQGVAKMVFEYIDSIEPKKHL